MEFKTEEAKWAWLAALIDGEGCITWSHRIRHGVDEYSIKIIICSTTLELLEEIKKHFDCSNIRILRGKGHGRFGNKPQYVVCFEYKKARAILPKIIPFLIVKRKRAEIAYEFLKLQENWKEFVRKYGLDKYREEKKRLIELMKNTK